MLLQEVANQFSDSDRKVSADTELRFLPDHARLRLTTVLDAGDGWRKVLHLITHPDDSDRMLFNADHARVLENYTRGSRSDEILKTWSTTGRNRPKICDLVDLLKQAELHRAASIVEVEVLQQAPGDDEASLEDLLDEPTDLGPPPAPPSENYHDEVMDSVINETPRFSYDYLAQATGNFCNVPLSEGGSKVGEGAFGVVYKGTFLDGTAVAVKRMKDSLPEQFLTELSYLKDTYPNDITPVLDTSAGVWDQELAQKVYEVGDECVRLDRRQRPTMEPIYEELVKLNDVLNGPTN
ncbi:hypothetical protein HPB52_025280 [Rhipicephalus sanguineus]|uniref:Interleukin-1 receptor-associated kinase 4 n=1 Tax=Rhipicephalus sanguineus TaxID=34632 RepID=A0A9D4SMI0_RHISA|nr:hypothetical protein HPB52_025280 [Rhipicephalus sanguineus]